MTVYLMTVAAYSVQLFQLV